MGRPYLAPPNLPAEQLATLRQPHGHDARQGLCCEAQKIDLEVNPVSEADVESLVKEGSATPPEVIAKAKAAAGAK